MRDDTTVNSREREKKRSNDRKVFGAATVSTDSFESGGPTRKTRLSAIYEVMNFI